MQFLIPNFIFDNVSQITADFLLSKDIHGVILDLDGTLCCANSDDAPEYSEKWLKTLIDNNISVILLSNNKRLNRVSNFCDRYGIPLYRHKALKPLKHGFTWAVHALGTLPEQTAMIGDQIFTDVLGGNLSGLKTFFVYSLDKSNWLVKIRHLCEKPFLRNKQN